ncbi:MAG: hypothetical protein Q8Q09_01650 [Deltaproteobacteria bacterium]|nr:hypothetical protein [Deltaproteobacteria bacterium]
MHLASPGGLLLELVKGSVALWRARVRRSIRAMGEDPDDPKIAALSSSMEATDGIAKEDKPEGR